MIKKYVFLIIGSLTFLSFFNVKGFDCDRIDIELQDLRVLTIFENQKIALQEPHRIPPSLIPLLYEKNKGRSRLTLNSEKMIFFDPSAPLKELLKTLETALYSPYIKSVVLKRKHDPLPQLESFFLVDSSLYEQPNFL